MSSKIDFLKEKNPTAKIVSSGELAAIGTALIPVEWVSIFSEEDTQKRKTRMIEHWKKKAGDHLVNTITYFHSFLDNVELIEYSGRYSILYSIASLNGTVLLYEGGNPLDTKIRSSAVDQSWKDFPKSIRNFYEHLHNGFSYYASESMGLVPVKSIVHLKDVPWEILNELEEPLRIDLTSSFSFFSNGNGGYVVIDTKNCKNENSTVWWKDDQPDYEMKFWSVVDEWITIGFE
ncbi:MAG TPA: SMI1/KNR4 family protein [Spirochaetota bacterium]